jgi:ligand-binding SRPBCC domain-containing protein
MKLYYLKRQQVLPITLHEAWDFFSTPINLAKITPATMSFELTHITGSDNDLYPGQLICYKLTPLPGFTTFWMTEITHVREPEYFVDEQRFGPYKLWNHQHHFRQVSGGVEMTDELTYAIPYGWIGRLAHFFFVGKEVERIFDYRKNSLERLFATRMTVSQ